MSALLSYILVSIVVVIVMLVIIGKLMNNRIGPTITTDAIIHVTQGTQAVLKITKDATYDDTNHATVGAEGELYLLMPDASVVMEGATNLLTTDGHISEFRNAFSKTAIKYFGTRIETTSDPIHPTTIFESQTTFASQIVKEFFELASDQHLTINSAISGVPAGLSGEASHPYVLGFKLLQKAPVGSVNFHEAEVFTIRSFNAHESAEHSFDCIDAACFAAYLNSIGTIPEVDSSLACDSFEGGADSNGICPLKLFKITVQLNEGHTKLPSNTIVFDAPFNLFIDGIFKKYKKSWKQAAAAVQVTNTQLINEFSVASQNLNGFNYTLDQAPYNTLDEAVIHYLNKSHPELEDARSQNRSVFMNVISALMVITLYSEEFGLGPNTYYGTGAALALQISEVCAHSIEVEDAYLSECIISAGHPEDPLVGTCHATMSIASNVCNYIVTKAFDYANGLSLPLDPAYLIPLILSEYSLVFDALYK